MSKATATPNASVANGRRSPQRTCVSCRTTTNKRNLIRLVRTRDGNVTPDPLGKAPGRGAYLCTEQACWDDAVKQGILDRALRTTMNATDAAAILDYRRNLDVDEEPR